MKLKREDRMWYIRMCGRWIPVETMENAFLALAGAL